MKTLRFILFFIAIFGLIEAADWRITDYYGLNANERGDFRNYVKEAIYRGGGHDNEMSFLRKKMEQQHGGTWSCFHGNIKGSTFRSRKSATVKKGNDSVWCFKAYTQ